MGPTSSSCKAMTSLRYAKPGKRKRAAKKRRNLKWACDADLQTKSRKELVKILDTAFASFIRKRDGKCVQCGKTEGLTCGHLFSRTAYSTRWDEENCWGQCLSENLYHEHNAFPFTRRVEQLIGRDKVEALHTRFRTPRKFKDHELIALILKYSEGK